jgi:GNAT superfamily N-acetyltransferase
VFEIDGESYNGYCERLLLLAKLFLEEKRALSQDASQYAQVRTFHFYVACRWNGRAQLIGYFSKLKNPAPESHILSCILVLPHEQRKGYGNLLIDLAYQLAAQEGRRGTAERPLSKLGQKSFYPYWMRRLVPVIRSAGEQVSIAELAIQAGLVADDVVEVLKHFDLLKEWGKKGVVLLAAKSALDLWDQPLTKKSFNPAFLHWTPSYSLNSV